MWCGFQFGFCEFVLGAMNYMGECTAFSGGRNVTRKFGTCMTLKATNDRADSFMSRGKIMS